MLLVSSSVASKKQQKSVAEQKPKESEEVFFNTPLIFLKDPKHSTGNERRFGVLGKTNTGRRLEIYFTVRNKRIRVIASWDMNRKSRIVYIAQEEQEKKQKRGEYT